MNRRLSGQAVASIAMVVMNIGMYGFTIAAARRTTREEFGAITALLSVLLIANVVSLGLQATTARRIAVGEPADLHAIVARGTRVTIAVALGVGVLTAASTIVLTPLLKFDSFLPVILCGAAMVPLTIFGAQCGVAQGESRWYRLAVVYAMHGIGRLVVATGFLFAFPTATGAMVGVAVGSWLPVVTSLDLLALRPEHTFSIDRLFTREALTSSGTLLAYFAFTNTDALLARSLFKPHIAGLYAAGLIIVKAAAFLPQFVGVVLFPRLARDAGHRSRLLATSAVLTIGACLVAGTAALPHLALILAGGDKYAEISDRLWLFATSGSAQALLYVLVFDSIARRTVGTTVLLWVTLAVVATSALLLQVTVTQLVTIMALAALVVSAIILLGPAVRTSNRPPAEVPA